jgi:hypothetical protein
MNLIKDKNILKFLIAIFILQLYFTLSGGYLAGSFFDNFDYLNSFIRNIEADNKINDYVKKSDGNILIEASGFAIQNQIEPSFDIWKVHVLEERGIISSDDLYKYCVEKNFSLILSFGDLEKINGIMRCIHEKYVLIDTIPVYQFEPTRFYGYIDPMYQIPRRVYKLKEGII